MIKEQKNHSKKPFRLTSKQVDAKTDADADPPRFAGRKMMQVWRAYKEAMQAHHESKNKKASFVAAEAFKQALQDSRRMTE